MSLIRQSSDLEVVAVRIFEDFCRSGGDFYIVSPWIRDFSFTEAVLTNLQLEAFGTSPSLSRILQSCSKSQPNRDLTIISHNFGIKPTLGAGDIRYGLEKLGLDFSSRDQDLGDKSIEDLLGLYLYLSRTMREYSKFNNPWLPFNFRSFEDYARYVRDPENYRDAISAIVHSIEQVGVNGEYLSDLRKFLEIKNVRIKLHNNFHAKIFVAGSESLTGSSNWTFSGFTKNDEVNVFFSEVYSQEGLRNIKERCHELEKQASDFTADSAASSILLHDLLKHLYLRFFDWLTDNKTDLIEK